MSDEEYTRKLLTSDLNDAQAADSDRVDEVIKRARRHTAASDLMTLVFSRMWTVLVVLVAPLFTSLLDRSVSARHEQDREGTSVSGETRPS